MSAFAFSQVPGNDDGDAVTYCLVNAPFSSAGDAAVPNVLYATIN